MVTNVNASARLISDYSLEMTAKDLESLRDARYGIPAGTPVSVTFLPGEDLPARVAAASAVREYGFIPVPHISARRLHSYDDLRNFLGRLDQAIQIERAFVVAGDPPQPMGPFEDALAVIRTGELHKFGVRKVGISGYPEGHPNIPQEKLWTALKEKHKLLREYGHDVEIMTQFAFDAGSVLTWLERVRQETAIDVRVRVGIPGPASVKMLLRFATRCGVNASAKVMAKYGVSITKLVNSAGPEALIDAFAERLDRRLHGDVKFHFYSFGGLKKTTDWINDYLGACGSLDSAGSLQRRP